MIEEINTVDDITHSMSPLRRDMNERLFTELPGIMNEIHGTDFSDRFWKILLRDHTRAMISRIELLEKREIKIKPDLYPVNKHSIPGRKEKFTKGLILFVKHLKSINKRSTVEHLLKNENEFRIGFPEFPGIEKEGLGIKLPIYTPVFYGGGNKVKRDKVDGISKKITDPFFKNVVGHLPKLLVEYFQKHYESVKVFSPEKKQFHVHTTNSDYNQMLIAKYIEQGSGLIWYQHGSYYGEFQGDSSHDFESSVADKFRTWGWKIRENDQPWKAYRLEHFRHKYSTYKLSREYDLLLAFPKIKKNTRKLYKEFTDYLLLNLDNTRYKKILARPRALNKVFSHKSNLSFIDDHRVDKTSGLSPMAEDMARCRIVLQMTVPATNFLECIYLDHITVGFLQNDQPTEVVKPYYDFFLEAGVLHQDVDSLIQHLNRVDPEEWWNEVKADSRYQDFKQTFTRRVEKYL